MKKKLFERYTVDSFDSFRSQFFVKVISCFKSCSLNEYDLRILSSVFLMEMFDLRGKELKYAKELLLNHYRNPYKNWGSGTCVGRVKTVVTNHLRKMFPSRKHKAAERNTAARINSHNWNQFLMLSKTFCSWDKQHSADSYIIQLQFYLTLECTKDQSYHFCDCV